MIVGVPLVPECDGVRGDQIGPCLAVGDMIERPDPAQDCELYPSCDVEFMGKAYPPVRLVNLAQAWGAGSVVSSICRSDWAPSRERRVTGIRRGCR